PTVLKWTILQQVASSQYHPGEWNTLRVRLEKDKIRCYVNDELVIESTDNALTEGRVGLAKFRDTKAAFKNFRVGANLAGADASGPAGEITSLRKRIAELGGEVDADSRAALQAHVELSQSLLSERAASLELQAAQLRKLAVNLHRQSVQNELVKLF